MKLANSVLVIAVLVSNSRLQTDDVTSDVYDKQLQADDAASDVYTKQLQADDAASDVHRKPFWCAERDGDNVTDHTECWRGRTSPHLGHQTPSNVTLTRLSHFPLRKNALDSSRRSVRVSADGTAGVARLRRADSRGAYGPGPDGEELSGRTDLEWFERLDLATRSVGVSADGRDELVRPRRADSGTSAADVQDWSKQFEAEGEIVRLRRAEGQSGPVIEDWSKQLEAEEIIRVVSCQVDMLCSPVNSKTCRCPPGQAGCVVPRARVSQISRTRSGALNMFCVGVSLSHEEAGATPQTSCKYFSTDNAKYRVFANKVPETGSNAAGKPRIRYRACLKPMS
ncbi:PREDICTED: uncharacterized protein LOC109479581 [Branchiostoma belcheri]|uniref:Uncharacterized protein LOC109479581 n=1 Tax=Branchiostoma belcheri TaxID=7741 RepID=A0A6P5A5T0_BRABE|nr:PREDICTED: uncharacterized protein LOC109479581 [Branchiostoma belcheri]